jgi:pseudo-rSAM protein
MKRLYFFLEPYVHVSLKNNRVFIFNPLNGKSLDYKNKPEIIKIIKRLLTKNNLFVIKLLKREQENHAVLSFINKIRDFFMGDLLYSDWFIKKPIQVKPGLKILEDKAGAQIDNRGLIGLELMSNLYEISLYINDTNNCDFSRPSIFRQAYKQFLCYGGRGLKKEELPLGHIKNVILETEASSIFRINVSGGDIFSYSKFKELTELLNDQLLIKAYYLHYLSLIGNEKKVQSVQGPGPAGEKANMKWELNIFVNFQVKMEEFSAAKSIVDDSGINTTFHFIIEKEEEIAFAEKLIMDFKLSNYSFQPFYNGRNLDFFKEHVFVTREEILASCPTQKDILARGVLNQTNFGKLTILSNGNIHANMNLPSLGKVGENSLYDVIYKELRRGKSWRRTRAAIAPCRGCVLQYLCPSPSNYEYALGRNNLCNYHQH